MNQNYTMYVYKTDRRTKTSERLFSVTVHTDQTDDSMQHKVKLLHDHSLPRKLFRIEYAPVLS